jgi:hypothetical protein
MLLVTFLKAERGDIQMSKRSIGPSTAKKNIKKESQHYFVLHQTHRYLQVLARQDDRTIGTYLDRLIEREAKKNLPAELVEQIIQESQAKEAERLAQAEHILEEQKKAAG